MVQEGSLTIQIQAEPITEARCSECGQMLDLRDVKPLTKVICPICNTEKKVPGRFANYLVMELLGQGGMGAVYRGLDPLLDRPIALKVLLKSLREKPELREKFRREAKSAANINHPNVTHVYAFGEEDGQPYIVMEYVAGKSLDAIMESEKKLDQAFVINTGLQIAEGLQAGSKIGLVHGDVKPENILYDVEYTAKLIDFGLASFVDEDVKGGIWGSPYYLSPERVQRLPTDERSDIYSLGATLYHALTGQPPFDGESAIEVLKARLDRPPKPLSTVRPDVHPSVARVVTRMLAKDLSKRHPDYATLITDLRNTLNNLNSVQFPTTRIVRRGPAPAAGVDRGRSIRRTTQRRRTADQSGRMKRTTGRLARGASGGGGLGKFIGILVFVAVGAAGGFLFLNNPTTRPAVGRPGVGGSGPNGVAPQVAGGTSVRLSQAQLGPCRGYGGTGTATASDGGATVTLKGPVWSAHPLTYVIRPNTVLEFDFMSRKEGALQGIGLAKDAGARTDRLFRLYGVRQMGIGGFDYAIHAPRPKHFVIPVGAHYPGSVYYIIFANDDNSDLQDAESTYSNIRLYDR